MSQRDAPDEPINVDSDWFLAALIGIVEQEPTLMKLPVTVNVGGLIVTGILASTADYLDNWNSELFKGRVDKDSEYSLHTIADELRATAPTATASPEYIHLRDASFILPATGAVPANRRIWWRGALSRVDGWILGTLTASS